MRVLGATDVGRMRTSNEDSYGFWIPEDSEVRRRRGVLLVVADGMGGAQAGEEASGIAVQTLMRAHRDAPGKNPLEELAGAMRLANTAVYEGGQSKAELHGMGTTCTAVIILGHDLLIAHVGDSRAYLLDRSRIRALTRDHSLVAEMVERGEITAENARTHPRRNIVTRAIGVGPAVEVDVIMRKGLFSHDSIVLLSSDGLHGVLRDDAILQTVRSAGAEQACNALIRSANEAGGPDNITVLLAWDGPGAGTD